MPVPLRNDQTHHTGAPFCHLCLHHRLCSRPDGTDGQESACNTEDLAGSVPQLGGSPGRGHGNPLQHSSLENPHGQRGLADYCPQGRKESDTTEQLSEAQHSFTNPRNPRAIRYLPPATRLPLTYHQGQLLFPPTGIPSFQKLALQHFTLYKRSTLVPVFLTERNLRRIFPLQNKVKSKNSVQCLVCRGLSERQCSERSTRNYHTRHLSIEVPQIETVSVSMCGPSLFILCIHQQGVSQGNCFYNSHFVSQKFHRDSPLADNRRNLYFFFPFPAFFFSRLPFSLTVLQIESLISIGFSFHSENRPISPQWPLVLPHCFHASCLKALSLLPQMTIFLFLFRMLEGENRHDHQLPEVLLCQSKKS